MKLHKSKNLFHSFGYAIQGLFSAFKQERNLKIHLIAIFFVLFVGVLLKLSSIEWIICVLLFGIVLISELINTAIESVVDLVSPEINPLAKQAKDIAASAVFVSAVISVIIAGIIFLPKLFLIFK